jgi:transcriptional regulator with XRE-family HTH domain
MTQEQLADRVGWSVGNVSQLERGEQGYSDEGLAALAELLRCTPGQILDVDPTDDNAIWSLWERAEGQRRTLLGGSQRILRTEPRTDSQLELAQPAASGGFSLPKIIFSIAMDFSCTMVLAML